MNKHQYYVSKLYSNWSVFRDGIQFASGFESEVAAQDFVNKISASWKK